MKTTLRLLTPDDARALLKHNTDNRPLRAAKVEQLAKLIKEGKWAPTHQGIGIAGTGRILDGQHRLHAIVSAGVAVEINVTTGLEEEVYRWIDCGTARQAHDRLHLVDDPRINQIACSVVNNYVKIAQSDHQAQIDSLENCFLSMSDAFLYVASAFSKPVRGVALMPVGAALASYHHKHPVQAVEACESLLTGRMLDDNNPILTLREALLAKRIRTGSEQYWKATSAFRAHLEGRALAALYAAVEDFTGNAYDKLRWKRERIAAKGALSRKTGT